MHNSWERKAHSPSLTASFGASGSYYGVSGNGACYFSTDVHAALNKPTRYDEGDKIVEVSLGASNSFVSRQDSERQVFGLSAEYELFGILNASKFGSIAVSCLPTIRPWVILMRFVQHVVLNSYKATQYFIALHQWQVSILRPERMASRHQRVRKEGCHIV